MVRWLLGYFQSCCCVGPYWRFVKLLVWTCLLVDYVLVLVWSRLFWFGINLGSECTFLQAFVNVFFLFLYYFLNFILHPEVISFQKCWVARHKVSFVLFYDGPECTLYVDSVFGEFMLFHELLLRFSTLVVQILPHWFDVILVRVMHSLWGSVLLCGRGSEFLLSVFLWRKHYLLIGLKVLLLIKIHCLFIFYYISFTIFITFLHIFKHKGSHINKYWVFRKTLISDSFPKFLCNVSF